MRVVAWAGGVRGRGWRFGLLGFCGIFIFVLVEILVFVVPWIVFFLRLGGFGDLGVGLPV